MLNVLMFEEDSRPAFVLTEPMVSSDLIWVNCNLISADKSEYKPTERMGPSSDVLYLYAETTNLSAEQCLARFLVVQCVACGLFSSQSRPEFLAKEMRRRTQTLQVGCILPLPAYIHYSLPHNYSGYLDHIHGSVELPGQEDRHHEIILRTRWFVGPGTSRTNS